MVGLYGSRRSLVKNFPTRYTACLMGDRPFRIVHREVLYRGRVVRMTKDTIRWRDGHTFQREVIHHPKSVVLLPILPDGRVVLIRQFRAAIERFIYEIPAGTTEPGEGLLTCCRRELAEETGYRAARFDRLCWFFPAPGVSTEEMSLYRARGLTKLRRPPPKDRDELITPFLVTAAEAVRMIRTGRIIDAKSILGILWGLGAVNFTRAHG